MRQSIDAEQAIIPKNENHQVVIEIWLTESYAQGFFRECAWQGKSHAHILHQQVTTVHRLGSLCLEPVRSLAASEATGEHCCRSTVVVHLGCSDHGDLGAWWNVHAIVVYF